MAPLGAALVSLLMLLLTTIVATMVAPLVGTPGFAGAVVSLRFMCGGRDVHLVFVICKDKILLNSNYICACGMWQDETRPDKTRQDWLCSQPGADHFETGVQIGFGPVRLWTSALSSTFVL